MSNEVASSKATGLTYCNVEWVKTSFFVLGENRRVKKKASGR